MHYAAKKKWLEPLQLLADMFPPALQKRTTTGGYLPLHIAAMPGGPYGGEPPLDVIYFLARAWPEAIVGGHPRDGEQEEDARPEKEAQQRRVRRRHHER